MHDVFLIYDPRYHEKKSQFLRALASQGITVSWDNNWQEWKDHVIKAELLKYKCIVCLWTKHSSSSLAMRTAYRIAMDLCKDRFVSVFLQKRGIVGKHLRLPQTINLSDNNTYDLSSWRGSLNNDEFKKLAFDIKESIKKNAT